MLQVHRCFVLAALCSLVACDLVEFDRGETVEGDPGSELEPVEADSLDPAKGPNECSELRVTAADVVPEIMLVLDKSGTMHDVAWDHDRRSDTADLPRWASLQRAVSQIAHRHAGLARFGATLFPALDASNGPDEAAACSIEDEPALPLGAYDADEIVAALPSADARVQGGSPTRFAILSALEHLGESAHPASPQAMLLVTDGPANCVPDADPYYDTYDEQLREAVRAGLEFAGVPTYVVGIDISDREDPTTGVNPAAKLSAVARAGGRPRVGVSSAEHAFYPANDAASLEQAMSFVVDDMQCMVALPDARADLDALVGTLDGRPIERSKDCSGEGWRWATPDHRTIELCRASCSRFRSGATLDLTYGCSSVP